MKRVHELYGAAFSAKSYLKAPPYCLRLYIDYGKPVTVGRADASSSNAVLSSVAAASAIGHDVFIGPKVNLITINHDVNPDNRSATYGRAHRH